jgi:hypothetical protein
MSRVEKKLCGLHLSADGSEQECTRDACAFWERGGAVMAGDCLIERLGLDPAHADLAAYLLDVRERVERARDSAAAEAAHLEFARRLGRDV